MVLIGRLTSGIMTLFSQGSQCVVALACLASETQKLERIPMISKFKHLSNVSPFFNRLLLHSKSDGNGGETEALLVLYAGGRGCRAYFISSLSGVTVLHPAVQNMGIKSIIAY